MREKLATRIGFILLSAGCAIGIGNVWRFPYVTGQSGGGWFVLLYLFFLAVLGIPVLVMEFATGRAAQRSLVRAHEKLVAGKRGWRIHGIAGLLGNTCLMMFYTTVAGWMLLYLAKTAIGSFEGLSPEAIGAAFGATLGDPTQQALAMVAVTVSSIVVCAFGLQRGLEPVVKWMMLALLVLIIVLAVNSILLDGAGKGLSFFLLPDAARMKSVGVGNVIVNAMNQSFFTLSLGIGAMTIFGSYIDKKRRLLGEAVNVAVLDTVVAVSAGLIIIPACFAYGVEPGQGPGLIFVTLPNVFNHMPLGRVWGSLFFLFMTFAALTTVLAVFENIIAGLCELTGWSRSAVCWVLGVVLPLLSLPCVFGFNVWSGFQPFGKGSCVLDFEDFIVSNMLLPLGSLAFVVFCCTRLGWGWKGFVDEANIGEGLLFPPWLRVYCTYVLPLVILTVFLIGLCNKFFGN